MPALSRDDVAHVAHLARLGLTDEELGRLEGQLNHILDQYAILAQLDTDDIPPTAQTIELENILRDDVVRPSLSVEAVLANAPEREGDRNQIAVARQQLPGAAGEQRPRQGSRERRFTCHDYVMFFVSTSANLSRNSLDESLPTSACWKSGTPSESILPPQPA